MPIRRAVFLDRDGVLNRIVERMGQAVSPRSADEFLIEPGAAAALDKLRALGFLRFAVSNQPDVSRGLMSSETLDALWARLRAELELEDIRTCCHDDADNCACRKPKPGMLLSLAQQWRVELGSSFMIGDTWRDIGCGRAAGCRTILLRRPYSGDAEADHEVDSLDEAVTLIEAINSEVVTV
jgi:D-glycero-D-manno-heptose 1,7-bisphosphate phosphatase